MLFNYIIVEQIIYLITNIIVINDTNNAAYNNIDLLILLTKWTPDNCLLLLSLINKFKKIPQVHSGLRTKFLKLLTCSHTSNTTIPSWTKNINSN